METNWFSAEDLFEWTALLVELFELKCQTTKQKKHQKYTFKKLSNRLKTLIQHNTKLAHCSFIIQLQKKLPFMSQAEHQLKGVRDVFTPEGDMNFGD